MGQQTFGRQTFGQQTFGRQTFGQQTFGQQTFGRCTQGKKSDVHEIKGLLLCQTNSELAKCLSAKYPLAELF